MIEPARRSKLGHQRFWYTVPHVMLKSATTDHAMLVPDRPSSVSLSHMTSTTPPKPSASPSHWSFVTRSPRNGDAASAVTTGCRPTTSAIIPAGMPWYTAAKHPAR